MDMIDGQFPKLKYLRLSNLDIKECKASEDHLSCLEQLHVAKCRELQELPCCLAEIATLQVINLSNCSLSTENSARRIKEEQEEVGTEQLVINTFSDRGASNSFSPEKGKIWNFTNKSAQTPYSLLF